MENEESEAEKSARLEAQRLEAMAEDIAARSAGAVQLVDHDLPAHGLDRDREWVHPGHADPRWPLRIDGRADEGGNKGALRNLLRKFRFVIWREKRRTRYFLICNHGYQTDVWITYPKDQWTEAEANEFHAAAMAHADWTAPRPTPHEFHLQAKQAFRDQHAEKLRQARTQQPLAP